MAASLAVTLALTLKARWTNLGDLIPSAQYFDQLMQINDSLAHGAGLDQADETWADERSLAVNTSDNLDLSGSLTNFFGTVTPARVKAFGIYNSNTTAAQNLYFGGAVSNAWEAWTPVAGSKIIIPPNGLQVWWNPSLAAGPITAGTGDIVKIENPAANSQVIIYQALFIFAKT